MHDYMIGLLVSLVFWWQNGAPLMHFRDAFLPLFRGPFRMLEIGPGHGIWTSFMLRQPGCAGVTGMDVSPKSLELTRACLDRFGLAAKFDALRGDICRPPAIERTFEGAVVSQVLEIVSDPAAALRNLHGLLKPQGLLYLNAPVDFAAPDHIRRWHSSAEIDALAADAGFERVQAVSFLPTTLARTEKTGYSYVVILKRN
jgi:SAM-dependent methyltransferase